MISMRVPGVSFGVANFRLVTIARRQLGEIGFDLSAEICRITARQTQDQIGLRVMPSIEIAHVIERQLFERADGPQML